MENRRTKERGEQMKLKDIRNNLASLIKDLLRDHESMEKSSDIAYDVGQITAYCYVLNKKKLSNMICDKFHTYIK